jgi:hypothetical protein
VSESFEYGFQVRPRKWKHITFIPAKVLTVEKQAAKHRVIVRILLRKYKGSFNTLKFGENMPSVGSCHDGRLDLIYYCDPGLKEGQPFPLWTIQ